MELINIFREKVLKNNEPFEIAIGNKTYHFMQESVGKAKYIYGHYAYNDEEYFAALNLSPELVAIVSDKVIYVVDKYILNYKEETEGIISLDEFTKKINEHISNNIFPEFYNNLEEKNITDPDIIDRCRTDARKMLFSKEGTFKKNDVKYGEMFSCEQVARSICGFFNIENEAKSKLEKEKKHWVHTKSLGKKIAELVKDKNTARDWECDIAKALNSINAKKVTVEFEVNGVKATAKVKVDVLLYNLKEEAHFYTWDFATEVIGKRVFKMLNIPVGVSVLKCENINKILFRNKEIYIKK